MTTAVLLTLLAAGCTGDIEPGSAEQASLGAQASLDRLSWPVIRDGESNPFVTTAQYLLRHHVQDVEVNGLFDARTTRAVREFQRMAEIEVDGVIGKDTWIALIPELIRRPQVGEQVSAVRYLLNRRYHKEIELDETYDEATEGFVTEVQYLFCLEQNGTVGPYTFHALLTGHSYCPAAETLLHYHEQDLLVLHASTSGRDDGADPLSNIRAASGGTAARRSVHGRSPGGTVHLKRDLLQGMERLLRDYQLTYRVTHIAGGEHSTYSYHYAGRAVDIGSVNGELIYGPSRLATWLRRACASLGAVEAFGPDNDPSGHYDHVHCAW